GLAQLAAKRSPPLVEIVQLDHHTAADESREMLRLGERSLDPGGPDLQHVTAGHHVLGLEITADLLVPVCAISDRDAGRTIQRDPDHGPARLGRQVQVPEVEQFLAEEGLEASGKLFPQLSMFHCGPSRARPMSGPAPKQFEWTAGPLGP